MSSFGHIIKQERLLQNMKQSNLARGICSTSYLSKIESNVTIPSQEIFIDLFERLKLEMKLPNEEESIAISSFYQFYKNAIMERDQQSIKSYLKTNTTQPIYYLELNNYYTYHLYLFRLMLVLEEQPKQLTNSYNLIIAMEDDFDDYQRFVFNLNLGLYNYLLGDYQESLTHLENSLKFMNRTHTEEWEIADYDNVLSLAYFKTGDYFHAIKYATKNLKFYQENLLYKRAVDSYIVIGLSYKNIKKYQEAEKYYSLGLKLAIEYKLFEYEGIIYQNIGALYSIQMDHENAIKFFEKSLDTKKENIMSKGYLITILSIVQEYFKQNNQEQVLNWSKLGLEQFKTVNKKTYVNLYSYYYHFNIYILLHSSSGDLYIVLKRAIKHFEGIGDYRHLQKYSILIANQYFKDGKYKAASVFYQKSIENQFKQNKITEWVDL